MVLNIGQRSDGTPAAGIGFAPKLQSPDGPARVRYVQVQWYDIFVDAIHNIVIEPKMSKPRSNKRCADLVSGLQLAA